MIVTHAHVDHASGAPALAARWPDAVFLKHPWRARDGRYAVQWAPLQDGDVVEVGDDRLQVIHTPGHSPDHICLLEESSRTLYCGDLVQTGTTIMIPTNGGDLASYLASLGRILALAPARLAPAHGDEVEAPASLLRAYIAHRMQREEEVIRALSDGLDSVEAIASRIYVGLSPDLVGAARDTVLAHLRKLEVEGRARQGGDGWQIVEKNL